MTTGNPGRGRQAITLFSLALLIGAFCPCESRAQNRREVGGMLERFEAQLANAGLLDRFGRKGDAAEKVTVPLTDAESARLAGITESFFRTLASSQLTMQDLMQFKDQTMRAHRSARENPLFPGQRYWDANFLAVERALMMGRAQMVQSVWRQTLINFFNAHPEYVGVVFGEMDIGSWVKMALKGLDFKADIDFSSVATLARANGELYRSFCESFAARTIYSADDVQARMDSVLTMHGQAGVEVFVGEWGKAFAEIDMLKRSNWKQIEVVRDASGRVTDVTFKLKSGTQLFWETAFRTGREVEFPKIVAEHEPMISLEMLRHLVHDVEHSTSFSRGEKIIKLLKFVERSYFMNKKATAGTDWDPYAMNDPAFAALADKVIKIKGDSGLTPQQIQEGVAEELTKFSEGKLADGTIDEFVAKITEQAKSAISRNAEAGLGNRLRKIAATTDESVRQVDLDRLWSQMRTEIGALNASGQTPPENVNKLLDLAMQLRDGGSSALYASKVIEFRNLLADVYKLPSTVADVLLSFDTVAKLRAYCKERLKWSSAKIDGYVKQARERYPKLSGFYDGFVEFNEQCIETSNGSVLLQASQWVDMGFGVYEAYMSAPDKNAALRAATEQLATIGIQAKWPIAGIPLSVYTSLSQGSAQPLAWAVAFYIFPGVGEIYTVSANLQRFDVLYRDKAFYDELGRMLECTEFDQEGKIIQFKLLGPGSAVRDKVGVIPPGSRERIVQIFEQPGSPFAASRNFNYWRLLIPDKQFEPFSYVTRLKRLREYFPYSDEVRFWTVMLENQETNQLPDDRFNVRRLEALDQMGEQLRGAIWCAMADALEAGVKASDDKKVAEWKKKIAEIEDDLSLGDLTLGRGKGLQSKIDREITVSTGAATQVIMGDNIYAVGLIYEKYINGYERIRKIKNEIFKIWLSPYQVDGAKAQSPPLKILLGGDGRRSAPALVGDLEKDLAAAEKCHFAHTSRGRSITVDLTQALRRAPDPGKDAEHLKTLGQLAFEWEHLLDDTPGRDGVLSEGSAVAQMRTRRQAYRDYLALLGVVASLRVEGPATANVDEPVPLKAVVEVDVKVKSRLKFAWSEGKAGLGESDSIQFLSRIRGPHQIKVVVSHELKGKRMRIGEADHRIVIGASPGVVVRVEAPTSAGPDERVNLKAVIQADKALLPKLRCVWTDGQTALSEGDSIWFASRVEGTHKIKVEVRGKLQEKEETLAEAVHEVVVAGNDQKVTAVTAGLEGVRPQVVQNGSVQINARDFRSGQEALFTAETDSATPRLQAKWCSYWELTHKNEVEAAGKAGKTTAQLCPPRPAGWGIDTFKLVWQSRPALAFLPKETTNEGGTSLSASASPGAQVTLWGEIQRRTDSGFVRVGETERKTFTIGKSTFEVKLETSKTSLKPGEVADVLATVRQGVAKRPLKFAWSGEYGMNSSDGSKVSFVSRQGGPHVLGVEVTDAAGLKGTASITLTVLSVTATLEGLKDPVIYGTSLPLNAKIDGLDKILETALEGQAGEPNKNLWVLTKIERMNDLAPDQYPHDPRPVYGDTQLTYTCNHAEGPSKPARIVVAWTAPPAKAKPGETISLPWSCSTTAPPSGANGYLYLGHRPDWRDHVKGGESWLENPQTLGHTYLDGKASVSGVYKQTFPEGLPGKTMEIVFIAASTHVGDGETDSSRQARAFIYTYEGKEAQKVAQDVKVIWQSEPAITFDPPTSLDQKTTALFDRMGTVKIWAEIQIPKGPVWETVAETEQKEVQVVAPKFSLSYQPPEGKGRVGQEVKATVQSDPPLPATLLDFAWTNPGSSNRTDYEQNASTIGFKPKDTKPMELLVTARAPKGLETIAEIKGSYVVTPYVVKAEVIGAGGLTPQVWQEGKGLVNVARGTYAADQQVRVMATLEGTPKPPQVLWRWTVNEGTTLVGGETSAESTVSRHETGLADCSVEARNKEGILLGRGSASFSVTVSAEDLGRARERSRGTVAPVATPPVVTPPRTTAGGTPAAGTPPVAPADGALKAQTAAAVKKVEELLKQGKTHEAAAALDPMTKLDPAAAAALGEKTGGQAKKQGWEALQKWDFVPAMKDLELASRLLPADADAQGKLTHAKGSLGKWNEMNRLAPEFESLIRAKKVFSAYVVLGQIDRLENSMAGAPVGESALKARLNKVYNEANDEFNRFFADYRAKEKDFSGAKDWETAVRLTRQVLEWELGPLERDVRAALGMYEKNLVDQKEAWNNYLTIKASHEQGEYSLRVRAVAASRGLRSRLSQFSPTDPRYQEIEALADAMEAGPKSGEPATPISTAPLEVSLDPTQYTLTSGEKVTTRAKVVGGTPPYSYEWFNGANRSERTSESVIWTLRAAGPRALKVIVTDAAGNKAEAQCDVVVQPVGAVSSGQTPTRPPETIPAQPPSAGRAADFLAGNWQYVWDGTLDGRMVPAEAPYPVDITPTGGNRFTAKYSTGQYGSYTGELLTQDGRTAVRMHYVDPPRNYTAEFEGILLDQNTLEGRFSDSPGGKYEFRWTRTKSAPTPAPQSVALRLEKSRFAPGEEIRVQFTASPDYARDAWVGVVPSNIPHGSETVNDQHDVIYQYLEKRTSGVLVFKAPQTVGAYDLRMNDTDTNGREVASVSLTVGSGRETADGLGTSRSSEANPAGAGTASGVIGTAQAAEQPGAQSVRTDWAGQVVDIRTNKPLAGVEVLSSAPGRIDAHVGYDVKSGADGRFQIYLPKSFMKSMAEQRQPYVLHTNYHMQLRAVRMQFIRPMPEEVLFKLIPTDVYIKGRAVSAETGAPLPDIGVTLWRPGAACGSTTTDANGNFSFGPVQAFVSGTGQIVSDVRPPGLYTPRPDMVFEEKYVSYVVAPYGKGSERFVDVTPPRGKDGRWEPSLPLVSSFDDSIHTYVVLRLPKKGTVKADPSKHIASEIRGLPPGSGRETAGGREPEAVGGAAQFLGGWTLETGGVVGRSDQYKALYRGTLTFTMENGRVRGVFNLQDAETLTDVVFSRNEVTFTRPLTGFAQYYKGELASAGRIEGVFDHKGTKQRWWATRPDAGRTGQTGQTRASAPLDPPHSSPETPIAAAGTSHGDPHDEEVGFWNPDHANQFKRRRQLRVHGCAVRGRLDHQRNGIMLQRQVFVDRNHRGSQ